MRVGSLLGISMLLLALCGTFNTASAQAPATEWEKSYPDMPPSALSAICQSSDGGFASVGLLSVPVVAFSYNYWIVKTDALGNLQWEKHFGGFVQDYATTIAATTDGGYIVGGNASSNNGDVTGNHGSSDVWLLKLDALGNIQWKRCYGGTGQDACSKVIQLADGSYLVAGSTESADGDLAGVPNNTGSTPAFGSSNAWVFKLDNAGNITWQGTFGGTLSEAAMDVTELPGNELAVAGYTLSNNGDVSGNHGQQDIWVFKLNVTGTIAWQRCLGGSNADVATGIVKTPDGGLAVGGYTSSTNGDVTGFHGGTYDTWVVKLNAGGGTEWQKTLGGSDFEWGQGITVEGNNIVIASEARSIDGDITNPLGSTDVWLAALDNSTGNLAWEKSYGGSGEDGYSWDHFGIDIIHTTDGGMAFSAQTASPEQGTINGDWYGYLVKIHSPLCDTTTATHDTAMCVINLSLQLEVTGNGSYTWNDGSTGSVNEIHDTGTFWHISVDGCNMHTDTFHVANKVTVGSSKADTLVCRDAMIQLGSNNTFDNYIWNTGQTTAQIQATTDGTFVRMATNACNLITDTFTVKYIAPVPTPDLGPDAELCNDLNTLIGIPYTGVQYLWGTGETSASIHPTAAGMYTLTIYNSCESHSDSVYLKIDDCEHCLSVPTAFTPNNDGLNDQFGATPLCAISHFNMNVFDRWGELIFTTHDTNEKWDGTFKGAPMAVGTYFYALSFETADHRKVNRKGDVTLVR